MSPLLRNFFSRGGSRTFLSNHSFQLGGPRFFSTFKVNIDNYNEVVEKAKKPVILDCQATWCPPCRILGPKLEAAVDAKKGDVIMAVLDVDESPEIAERFNVSAIPAVFGLKNGKVVNSFIGLISDQQIKEFIDDLEKK